ncbi:hypothetical protein SH1V18_43500 [Vallitalea longa]|uniref:Uncharacterized protein n=1 Tax=Vallitalea longa TaxID=2936439 RepID=A0A9W5YD36_9FIRM|nr:DUF6544 family protein [Vallitalea longa]GKX31870.1 hypothetical protein SH1V18_43500 [Vallitalea longa]
MKSLGIVIILIILIMVYWYYGSTHRAYKENLSRALSADNLDNNEIITEKDLQYLPVVIQKYLRYVDVVGKKKINQFAIDIDGEMRLDEDKDWAPITAEQKTFINQSIRLFYMTMKYKGIPINGLHHFEKGKASMVIKILDLIKVVDQRGEIMNKAETVTFFNDMCIFAPSTLIDANITWEEIDELSVIAHYTLEGIKISAQLFFNEKGQLINFISNDRYKIENNNNYKQIKWSTPVSGYKNFNGYNLASIGQGIWHYEDRDFSYIKLNIKNIHYK